MISQSEEVKRQIADKEAEVQETSKQLNSKLETIGNLVHDSVPVSNDEVSCFLWFNLLLFYSFSNLSKNHLSLLFLRLTMRWLDRGGRKGWNLN